MAKPIAYMKNDSLTLLAMFMFPFVHRPGCLSFKISSSKSLLIVTDSNL